MEALTSSSPKIFAENYTRGAYLSPTTLSKSPQIRFFRYQKFVNVDFSLSFPLQFKAIESFASSSFSLESQANCETADDHTQTSPSKTVHVKFQLQKECLFGQRFLLVGDDPIFGLWDPSNAIPLEWSDGHIWTLELDLLVGKSVQFKFIHEVSNGEVVWQPGPDRLVQTWETKKTIIVLEDWENAEIQKITEEPVINPIVESVATKGLPYSNFEVVDNVKEGFIAAENIDWNKILMILINNCAQSRTSCETADDQTQASPSKTVHVKFQLQKECLFGQRFLLVGDDPFFGSWDPSNAIPLGWSDGHIWTLELDLLVGKSVQFKFIHEVSDGEVVWQPGPYRLVQTWETKKTIIVLEDWENAEIQKITEEPMINPIVESVVTKGLPYLNVEWVDNVNEGLIVAENISCPKEEPMG